MTRRRFDLTDFEWSVIQPLLPNKSRGVPRVDDRRVINVDLLRKNGEAISDQAASLSNCAGLK